MILFQLLHNLSFLIALSIISGFLDKRYPRTKVKGLVLQGLLFGIVAIAGMLQPVFFKTGIIFDGRSVVISIATLFFGPVTGIISAIIAITFRFIQGGPGVVPGTFVVATAFLIGLIFHLKKKKGGISIRQLFYMGLTTHVTMLIMMFTLPFSVAISVVQQIGIPVIIVYPLATVLIGKILSDQESNIGYINKIIASEEKFRSVFENSMVGISISGIDKSMKTNKAFSRILGYTEEELLELRWQDITHPESVKHDQEVVASIISGEKNSHRWEKRYIGKNGNEIWVDINTVLRRDNSGKPQYFITAIYDITERKLAEQSIRESEEKYHYMFANNPQPMWIYDLETLAFLEVNNAALNHYGYTIEEFRSMTLLDIRPKEDIPIFTKDIERTRKGFNDPREWRHLKKNGELIIVEVISLPIVFKNRKAKHVMINDITERKNALEELRKLSLVVEHSPALVLITDKNGNIEYVNDKVLEMTGYTREEVIGRNPRLWASGYHSRHFYEDMWEAISSGNSFKSEILNKKKTGELYWESALISSLKDKEGNITHFVSVNEDITDKKEMIEELIIAKDRAEQSAKLKSEFLAQMSHEIRTPLNAIVGIVGYLKDLFSDRMDNETRRWFESLDISSDRIIRTVELILRAAELQTSGYKTTPEKLDLNSDILSKLLIEFRPAANQKGLELLYYCYVNAPVVIADEYCLAQIFANLIGNAIKYTDEGKIEIIVQNDANSKLTVEIRDTGIGIGKEFLSRIFEPFTQEEQGYSRSFEGNGLGLALVKKYCELNNLAIEIESEKNVGSVFRILF